ncbi:uncharacterized protein PG986_012329 [Apiospora aurea]|uniref:Uncharacterized protein n=1 Tax=Apiospora aurea TaxID=335848 RepID=A0ABR1PZN6_9PEZI
MQVIAALSDLVLDSVAFSTARKGCPGGKHGERETAGDAACCVQEASMRLDEVRMVPNLQWFLVRQWQVPLDEQTGASAPVGYG